MANSKTIEIILKAIGDFSDVSSNITTIQKSLNQLKLPADLKSKFVGIFSDLEKETGKYQKILDSGFKTKGDVTGLEKTGNRIKGLFESLYSTMQKINPDILRDSFQFDASQFDSLNEKIQQTRKGIQAIANEDGMKKAFSGVEEAIEKLKGISKSKAIGNFVKAFKAGDIEAARQALEKLQQNINNFKKDSKQQVEFSTWLKPLQDAFNQLEGNTALQQKKKELNELLAQASSLESTQIENFFKAFEQGKDAVGGMTQEWLKFKNGADASARSVFDLGAQMDQLKSRIGYFFGISNVFNLFKRTVRQAIETVKELDTVMTETAVVTDFTVGDMWEKLPEYATEANALGASIRDLYAATTLYYQQGLQTEAAMGVGIETMKMARIAGMDAANATEAMTAALRGFNMEVNETNAVRVNDVYSELAAITAADTEQIATAMSKTASIAASANMEFETTAALLAQIIETTQEAPETAGTAMKTIIARFAEVKKLRSEGIGTGQDEEGEIIDVNKIQGALRTVGISMNDFFAGTEGLDSILLKLAEKWNTLDFETQRYIATIAAGSRQQSRFIAMMSDYERTMQLASAANNSAGASQEQFDKTLESMEAKLQKLKNAWDEFAMGLANNEILKFGVDFLTQILTTINNVTTALSGGNGLIKSIVNLVTVIGALKGGKELFRHLLGEGKIGIELSNGQKGFINFGGARQQAQSEGQKVGNIFINSLQRAIQQGKTGGIKQGVQSLFEEIQQTVIKSSKQLSAKEDLSMRIDEALMTTQRDQGIFELGEGGRDQSGVINQLSGLQEELLQGGNLDKISKKFQDLGGDVSDLGQRFVPVSNNLKTVTIDFQGVGMAATGVGMAISLLSGLFEKLGMEELAEKTKKLGSIMMSVGMIFTMLGPMINKLGISVNASGLYFGVAGKKALAAGLQAQLGWWPLIAIFVAIAGAVAILVGAFIAARNASPEYQLKQASEAADEAAEAADKAAKSYNNLKSSLESIEQKEDILDGLIVGTNEWKDAVSELNNQILDLLAIYPELAQFISSEGGVLTISTEGKDFITNKERQNKVNAEALNIGEQIDKVMAQKAVDYSGLDRRLIQYEWENVYETDQNGRQYVADVKQVENKQLTEELAKSLASGTIARDDERLAFLDNYEGAYEDFLAFGRALLTSDQAISIFTDSLLTAATANADVSEEFKSQIGGMYNEEMIDELIAKYETASNLPTEEDKRQYASMKGYTYEGGNKFKDSEGNEKTVGLQEIKEQLAPVKAQQEMTKAIAGMESVFSKLQNSSNGLEKAFANIISKADGMGLTFDNLKDLTDFETFVTKDEEGNVTGFTGDLEQIYAKVAQFYDPEAFYSLIAEALAQAELAKTQSAEKLKSIGLGDLDRGILSDARIDNQAMFNLANNLYDVFLTSGKEATIGLGQEIDSILKDLSPEDAQIFADALNTIDWQNLDDVEELEVVLEDMGFDYAVDGLDELKQKIITAAKATKTFNLDAIKEQVKSIEGLVEDIEDREDTERKFTQEEYDTIIKANPELASQFVATGLDEFVYVGDSMQSLIEALNQNTAALLGDYGEQVRTKAAMSEKWLGLEDQRFNSEYSVMELITSVIGGSIDASLYDVGEDGTRSQGAMDLINLMEQLGLGTESGRDLNSNVYSGEDLVRILTEEYNQYYGDFGAIAQQNADNAAAYTQTEETIRLSKMEGTEILNDNQATEENKQAALDAKVALEGLQEEYDKTTKSLKDQNSALASNEKLVKASIVDAKSYEDKLAELAKAYDENKDALADTNKGTREYQKALTNITKAAKEAFGDNITEDFVENNLDLFEDWYKGAEGSADKLRAALVDSLIEASNVTESEVSQIRNIVSGLDGLNFNIYGHADATQLFNELAAVMGSAKEAARAMEVLGYSVTWEPNGVTYMMVPDPDNPTRPRAIEIPNYKAVVTDGLGNRAGANRSSYGGNKGGGGGGGGGSTPKKWENPYDEFYNTVELLNEELRKREQLERRYQKLLDKTNTKASDLVSNTKQQLESLEFELKTRQDLLVGRERQMAEIEAKNSKYSNYAWYNEEKQVIEINWNKMQALDGSTNEDFTQGLEDYVSKLEEQQGLIEDELDAIYDIEDAIWEIYDQGKDEYFDLEEQIKEALQSVRQKEIDTLSEINDSINDTNSRLIDAMQSSIDKYRQDRENEKTEEELSDKQRRLAYLQQDTSGANALEIMQLQKEIEEGQEDYTDTLIDQKISELQEQNDEAAEQRQHQIDLLQAQLDHYLESQQVWDDIYSLINTGIGPDGIVAGSELENLLKESANFEGMSYLQKMEWLSELEDNVAKAVNWLMSGNSTEALIAKGELKSGETIKFTTADGEIVEGILDKEGNVTTSTGEKYTDVYRTYNGALVTSENFIAPRPVEPEPEEPEESKQTFTPPALTDKIKRGVAKAIINGNYGWGVGKERVNKLNEVFGANDIQRNYVNKRIYGGNAAEYSYTSMRRKFKQYKTGGLADFTGPAWLDGTKSKPEYILNADQTKAFFSLVNVLEGLSAGTSHNAQISGDSIYDIDINVESIGNDYDVEQMASTIKRMINDDARYRNNNAINLSR